MKNKVVKSHNRQAGQYYYRGVYIVKSITGAWYVRCSEVNSGFKAIGVQARTRGLLIIQIDNALKMAA